MSKRMKPIKLLVVSLTLVLIGALLLGTVPNSLSARLNGSRDLGNVEHFTNH